MVCRHVKCYLFRDVDGVSRVFFGNVTNAIDARIEKAISNFNLKAKFNYRVRKNTYEVAILGSYFNLGSIPDEVRATVTISPEGITARDVQFICKYVDENNKEEESGMKTLTIHNVEAMLYFEPWRKLVCIEENEYVRRIKERCEDLGYDKKPLDDYSNQFGYVVRFIVNDYTGPTIPDRTYVKMDCDVIIKDTDDVNVVNIKCNRIIPEEENTMLKKEANKESYARVAAAARRYIEYLEQELYKIDDEIARLKKEVEKFE